MTFVRFSSVSASFCNSFYLNFINSQIFHVVFILTGMVILDFKVSEDLLMFSIYSGSGIYCLIEALARLLILLISYLTKGIECRPAHTCPIYTNGYDSSNRWSIGTNGRIGTNRKGCHSSGSIGEYASH